MVQRMTAQLMPGPQYHLDDIARNAFFVALCRSLLEGFRFAGVTPSVNPDGQSPLG
jgi:hypothetical protein